MSRNVVSRHFSYYVYRIWYIVGNSETQNTITLTYDKAGESYFVNRRTFFEEALLGASLTKLRIEEKEKYTV